MLQRRPHCAIDLEQVHEGPLRGLPEDLGKAILVNKDSKLSLASNEVGIPNKALKSDVLVLTTCSRDNVASHVISGSDQLRVVERCGLSRAWSVAIMTPGNYTTIIACLVELPGCHGGLEPVVGVWKIKIPINAEVRATSVKR